MTAPAAPPAELATPAPTFATPVGELHQIAAQVLTAWRNREERPDVRAVFARFPILLTNKKLALDLAYEEYALREETDRALAPVAFCAALPAALQSSARELLDVHGNAIEEAEAREKSDSDWPKVGQRFSGFQLRRELGRGAFARAYLAIDPLVGNRPVVLKVMRQDLAAAEVETLGRLRHPHIIPVYSVRCNPDTGMTTICMPYLGGLTLFDLRLRMCTGGRPPLRADAIRTHTLAAALPGDRTPTEPNDWATSGSYVAGILNLARPLAHALAYLHAQGVSHRDLKSSNVLLAADGRPYLLDFNLAADRKRFADQWGGTPGYMAPELLAVSDTRTLTEEQRFGPYGDIYSFGMVLYEMLAGQHPYPAPPKSLKPKAACQWQLERRQFGLPSLRKLNPQVDPLLARLIERCLSPDPRDRPASAAELARVLDRLARPPVRLWRWAMLHPRRATAAAVAATVLLGGAGVEIVRAMPSGPGLVAIDEQSSLQAGKQAFRAGHPDQALEQFDRALNANPRNADALYWRGRAHLGLAKFDLASQDFTQANRRDPLSQYALALAYSDNCQGKDTEAIQLYKSILKEGRSAIVLNNLGYSELRHFSFREADQDLQEALALDPRLAAAHHNLLRSLLMQLAQFHQGKRWTMRESDEVQVLRDRAAAVVMAAETVNFGHPVWQLDAASLCFLVAFDPARRDEFLPKAWDHLNRTKNLGRYCPKLFDAPPYVFWRDLPEAQAYRATPVAPTNVIVPLYNPLIAPLSDDQS